MARREQRTISFSEDEKKRIIKIANVSGETFSGYIRRQILIIVAEEEKDVKVWIDKSPITKEKEAN